MQQSRLFIAIALSFLVFLVWEVFFVDRDSMVQNNNTIQSNRLDKTVERPAITPSTAASADNKEKPVDYNTHGAKYPDLLQNKPRIITVNTPLYSVQISEKGAVFKSFILKKFRENGNPDSPYLQLCSSASGLGTVLTQLRDDNFSSPGDSFFKVNIPGDTVDITDASFEIPFTWISPEGLIIEKRFLFSPETYLIGLDISIKNNSTRTINGNLALSLEGDAPKKNSGYAFEGPTAFINNKLEQVKIKKLKDKNIFDGTISWIALENRYFASSIISDNSESARMHINVEQDDILKSTYVQTLGSINSGEKHVSNFYLYFGPKKISILSGLGYHLDKIVNFGMFDFLARPCLYVMNFLHKFIPNYGFAIIILTILIKLILWPLGSKSYKSMSEMKKLQPLMTQIREKYKNDKQRMNQEIMGLYKTYKVNPLGGCLPMIVQIPIFFAFYRMLYQAIELRHAPFLGWINDLSAPDRLFHFNFTIPFMEPPYGVPVLTIIMGGTMFLQQKMSPPMGDPAQAKIMMLMPIFFTAIFINFSSGLVLYWLVNNVLSIAQQYYIQEKHS
ncbi:YidC/Oxa1 family membrane protein insertase [Desulfosarcina sp. BuS5]|uniref:membrane protein insertase YidC n=1 Tax=Desulfosarcina sp. BuS5 TaxID=933262 RepID=UPI0004814EB2|nr:membrane protein insertase YidC [Desulfosarcina sp. BuS5]WDN90467.1 YidC/Oxa1 family membrane protein insertase [Desulfosarcina sp. BuS5]